MDVFSVPVILASVLVGLIGVWYVNRRRHMQLFKRLGIPGPKPHFLFGSFYEFKGGDECPVWTMDKWDKKYGDVYGYFEGATPRLCVRDLDMVKQILIKDFSNFQNRERLIVDGHEVFGNSIIGLRGQRWKEVRSILSPVFSSAKLKQLNEIFNSAVTNMLESVDKKVKADEMFNIADLFQRQTLDVIGETALAVRINSQKHEGEHTLLNHIRETFTNKITGVFVFLLCFPDFAKRMFQLLNLNIFHKTLMDVVDNVKQVIVSRRATHADNSQKSIDVLQLLLDAEDTGDDNKSGRKTLSDLEIVGNAFAFLLAGYETTSSALAYTAHLLAKHQDVQERLYEEIKTVLGPDFSDNDHISYDKVQQMQYLEQVFCESLRILPPVILFVMRDTVEDTELVGSNGRRIPVPKGMPIIIPVWQIHHDHNIWPDPYKFDPDRFSPENRKTHNSMAFLPFGAGPRNCIGMRFAQIEAKVTIARLILKYRLMTCSKSESSPTVTVPTIVIVPVNGINVKAQLR